MDNAPDTDDTMGLCSACDTVLRVLLEEATESPRKIQHYTDPLDLLSSARTCRVCSLFTAYPLNSTEYLCTLTIAHPIIGHPTTVGDALSRARKVNLGDVLAPITFYIPNSPEGVSRLDVNISIEDVFEIVIGMAVWSDHGGPAAASGVVCTRPPLTRDDSTESFKLINSWLENCLLGHEKCRRTVSGGIIDETCHSELPARVLDVGKDSNDQCVTLVETGRRRGQYLALSHCWGPPEKQPLRTTNDTLPDHLNGIAFETLPKTFRDAVTVTRAVGLRYLWIDSLCIVQDDENDWLQESAQMGSLYERAQFTIAASGAKDSTEGCFLTNRPRLSPVKAHYHSNAGEEAGSIYLSPIPYRRTNPEEEPLQRRAWVFQERHLSRRMLHFTKRGLFWTCRTEMREEHLQWLNPYYPEGIPKWDKLIVEYSHREITKHTDRLIAIQGLANELQKARNDQYRLGMWTADLPSNLLWQARYSAPSRLDLPKVPSWRWAQTDAPKVYPFMDQECVSTLEEIMIEDSGILNVRGPLAPCHVSARNMERCCVRALGGDLDLHPEYEITLCCKRKQLHYIMDSNTGNGGVIGVASFDKAAWGGLYCLFAMRSERRKDDPLYYDTSQPESSTSNNNSAGTDLAIEEEICSTKAEYDSMEEDDNNREDNSIEEYSDSSDAEQDRPKARSTLNDSIRPHYPHLKDIEMGTQVYFVLLLQEVPGRVGHYRRVGVGVVYPNGWAEGKQQQLFIE